MDSNLHTNHRRRVFENFLRAGNLDGFSDVQILEMLLFYVIPRRDTNKMAHSMIDKFGDIENIFNASPLEIMKITKYSAKTACIVSMISRFAEISKRNNRIENNSDYHIISEYAPKLIERYVEDNGFKNFNDLEILELFAYFGMPRSIQSDIIYDIFDEFILLRSVFRQNPQILLDNFKISINFACLLGIPCEIHKRYNLRNNESVQINSSEKIKNHIMPYFRDVEIEYFYVVCLNDDMREIDTICISKGNESSAEVKVNTLIKKIVLNGAKYIFVVHNHPSGDATASAEDIRLTIAISAAVKALRVKLLDHIIIGKNAYFSFAQKDSFDLKTDYSKNGKIL